MTDTELDKAIDIVLGACFASAFGLVTYAAVKGRERASLDAVKVTFTERSGKRSSLTFPEREQANRYAKTVKNAVVEDLDPKPASAFAPKVPKGMSQVGQWVLESGFIRNADTAERIARDIEKFTRHGMARYWEDNELGSYKNSEPFADYVFERVAARDYPNRPANITTDDWKNIVDNVADWYTTSARENLDLEYGLSLLDFNGDVWKHGWEGWLDDAMEQLGFQKPSLMSEGMAYQKSVLQALDKKGLSVKPSKLVTLPGKPMSPGEAKLKGLPSFERTADKVIEVAKQYIRDHLWDYRDYVESDAYDNVDSYGLRDVDYDLERAFGEQWPDDRDAREALWETLKADVLRRLK